jgi:hypothetical protein
MIERLLQFPATFHGEGRLLFDLGEIFFRNKTALRERFAGQQFDLQPYLQFPLFGPDLAHFRA